MNKAAYIALVEVVRSLTAELDTQDLLDRALAGAMTMFPTADAGVLYLYSKELDRLTVSDAIGLSSPIYRSTIRPGESLSGKAYQARKPKLYKNLDQIADVVQGSDSANLDAFVEASGTMLPTAAICAPLLYKGHALGVLTLESLSAKTVFDEEDLQLLDTLAQSVAVVLAGARLYEAERRARMESAALHEDAQRQRQVLSRQLDIQHALMSIVREKLTADGLAARLATLTGSAAYVVDALYRLRAAYPPGFGSLGQRIPKAQLPKVLEALESSKRGRRTIEAEMDEANWILVSPVLAESDVLGHVLVIVHGHRPDESDLFAVEAASVVGTAEALLNQIVTNIASPARRGREQTVRHILSGEKFSRTAITQSFAPPFYLVVGQLGPTALKGTEPESGTTRAIGELIREHLGSRSNHTVVITFRGDVIIVWQKQSGEGSDVPLRQVLTRVVQELSSVAPDCDMQFTISREISEWNELPASYLESRITAEIRRSAANKQEIASAANIGIYRFLLSSSSAPEALDFAQTTLKSVFEYDDSHDSRLVETLRCWIRNSYRTRDTAQALIVHPHTIEYRLSRVAELTGLDTKRYDDRLTLDLALRILDVASIAG